MDEQIAEIQEKMANNVELSTEEKLVLKQYEAKKEESSSANYTSNGKGFINNIIPGTPEDVIRKVSSLADLIAITPSGTQAMERLKVLQERNPNRKVFYFAGDEHKKARIVVEAMESEAKNSLNVSIDPHGRDNIVMSGSLKALPETQSGGIRMLLTGITENIRKVMKVTVTPDNNMLFFKSRESCPEEILSLYKVAERMPGNEISLSFITRMSETRVYETTYDYDFQINGVAYPGTFFHLTSGKTFANIFSYMSEDKYELHYLPLRILGKTKQIEEYNNKIDENPIYLQAMQNEEAKVEKMTAEYKELKRADEAAIRKQIEEDKL